MYFKVLVACVCLLFALRINCENPSGALTVREGEGEDGTDDESSVSVEESEATISETFVPRKEWQEIRSGQVIPAGLHVRVNLATGLKEAKLLGDAKGVAEHGEGNEQANEGQLKVTTKYAKVGDNKKSGAKLEEIKAALKGMKESEKEGEKEGEETSKFRNMDQLKKELSSVNLEMKSETEVLATLLKKYREANAGDKVLLLSDIEYLVHQYDVAQDFVKLNGLQLLVPDLNSTLPSIRAAVAFTLGSAMQGNPEVQMAVLKTNTLQTLLRLISFDDSNQVKLRAVYAISCLIRQFPLAQKGFLANGGINAFAALFKANDQTSVRLQVKIVTLLTDLLNEQRLALKYHQENDKNSEEKLRQYNEVNLVDSLKANEACEWVTSLLNFPDFDTIEKTINAMNTFFDLCKNHFKNMTEKLEEASVKLKAASESAEENKVTSSDAYFRSLHQLVDSLIVKVNDNKRIEL